MPATSHWRGHPIYYDGGRWRYESDDTLVSDTHKEKPCGLCGQPDTPEGHDPCLGTLPGVMNACCGHGDPTMAYIQFENGLIIRGFVRVEPKV